MREVAGGIEHLGIAKRLHRDASVPPHCGRCGRRSARGPPAANRVTGRPCVRPHRTWAALLRCGRRHVRTADTRSPWPLPSRRQLPDTAAGRRYVCITLVATAGSSRCALSCAAMDGVERPAEAARLHQPRKQSRRAARGCTNRRAGAHATRGAWPRSTSICAYRLCAVDRSGIQRQRALQRVSARSKLAGESSVAIFPEQSIDPRQPVPRRRVYRVFSECLQDTGHARRSSDPAKPRQRAHLIGAQVQFSYALGVAGTSWRKRRSSGEGQWPRQRVRQCALTSESCN